VTVNPDGTGLEFTSANSLVAVAAVPRFMGAQVNLVASTAAQNHAAGIAIPFGAEQYDTDGFHDTVTNPARMTIPAGLGIKKVKVSATVRVSAITAGSDNFLAIRKNGAEAYLGSPALHHENSAATSTTVSVSSGAIPVVAGDYFECWFSTSDTSTGLEADRTSFGIEVVEVEGGINIANVQNDATTARTLGLAGVAGGVVRALLSGGGWLAAISSVVIGSLTAGYLTTPVYAAAKAYFPLLAGDASSEHAIGFLVGLTAMLICEGVLRFIRVWSRNPTIPLDERQP
jgi:hypothetical protein